MAINIDVNVIFFSMNAALVDQFERSIPKRCTLFSINHLWYLSNDIFDRSVFSEFTFLNFLHYIFKLFVVQIPTVYQKFPHFFVIVLEFPTFTRFQRFESEAGFNTGFLSKIFRLRIFFLSFGVDQKSLFVWNFMSITEHLKRRRSSFWPAYWTKLSFERGNHWLLDVLNWWMVLLILHMDPNDQGFLWFPHGVTTVLKQVGWFHRLV